MRTIDIARKVGISVNTVRLYEQLGYLPPIPRTPNGYRQFTEIHLCHVLLIRQGMQCTWLGGRLRHMILDVFTHAAQDNFNLAESTVDSVINQLQQNKIRAETAVDVLNHWIAEKPLGTQHDAMKIGEVANYLNISADTLRNWERNGLITVPRATNVYRIYNSREVERLIVIYTLRQARYSTLSILRMFHKLENGQVQNIRAILDTPPPEDDIVYATDHWLSTLDKIIAAAGTMKKLLREIQTLH